MSYLLNYLYKKNKYFGYTRFTYKYFNTRKEMEIFIKNNKLQKEDYIIYKEEKESKKK